jgi:signal transduction histidine kinase
VRITAERIGAFARVWVADNGIGIPPHAHPRLFGMFQKIDNQYEGTGIGLAIVRKVVERMGGKVGVESEPGRGSRFWADLPLAEPETES